jgi:hypothetical protein
MIEVLKCLCYLTNHGNQKKIKKREREREWWTMLNFIIIEIMFLLKYSWLS